jgi:hypothetical protein
MSLVPSHDCFLFKKAVRNTCLLIESRSPIKLFQSPHGILQADPVLVLVRLLTQRFLIFSCHATHLLARCDKSGDPSARTTGRYL